ncbi:MAG: GNAT family N-acetyltransferase [Anaerolineae bacterium]|nr:GNAT family N-acetyltransferase [Anaerolineae bacterium]
MADVLIRQVEAADLDACLRVEHASFPPAEAATRGSIATRIERFPQGFLVAVADGQVAGLVNSGAADNPDLADEAFKALDGHSADGAALVIFSVAVLPELRRRGIAARLLEAFIARARQAGRRRVLLLCKPELVAYYARFGFVDAGLSASRHGGAAWHEMRLVL